MKALNYVISNSSSGIAIGIVGDKKLAEQDAVLAENVFESNHSDLLYDHLLYMESFKQFKKLMILKEYYAIWDAHWGRNKVSGRRDAAKVYQFMRRAIRRARLVLESQVTYENFLGCISARNNEYGFGNMGYCESSEA